MPDQVGALPTPDGSLIWQVGNRGQSGTEVVLRFAPTSCGQAAGAAGGARGGAGAGWRQRRAPSRGAIVSGAIVSGAIVSGAIVSGAVVSAACCACRLLRYLPLADSLLADSPLRCGATCAPSSTASQPTSTHTASSATHCALPLAAAATTVAAALTAAAAAAAAAAAISLPGRPAGSRAGSQTCRQQAGGYSSPSDRKAAGRSLRNWSSSAVTDSSRRGSAQVAACRLPMIEDQ